MEKFGFENGVGWVVGIKTSIQKERDVGAFALVFLWYPIRARFLAGPQQ